MLLLILVQIVVQYSIQKEHLFGTSKQHMGIMSVRLINHAIEILSKVSPWSGKS